MHETIIVTAEYFVAIPVAALVFEFIRLDKKHRLNLVLLLAVSVIVTTLLAKLAAALHQDPRPFVHDGITPYFAHAPDNGFPSDHTTYSALIAFVVFVYSRKLGIGLAVVSLLIGIARVIAGVHHGQDIIGGFLIAGLGVGISLLGLRAVAMYAARKKPKQD